MRVDLGGRIRHPDQTTSSYDTATPSLPSPFASPPFAAHSELPRPMLSTLSTQCASCISLSFALSRSRTAHQNASTSSGSPDGVSDASCGRERPGSRCRPFSHQDRGETVPLRPRVVLHTLPWARCAPLGSMAKGLEAGAKVTQDWSGGQVLTSSSVISRSCKRVRSWTWVAGGLDGRRSACR